MRKYVLLPVAALVLLIQAHRPERANPPVAAARTIEASLEVPSEVRALLNRSCTDCHSHRTAWPWYSQVAPVSWILASHVSEGRKHLNFSDWPGSHKPQALLEEICEEVEQILVVLLRKGINMGHFDGMENQAELEFSYKLLSILHMSLWKKRNANRTRSS